MEKNIAVDNPVEYVENTPLFSILKVDPEEFDGVDLADLKLGKKGFKLLKKYGYNSLRDLLKATVSDLKSIKNMPIRSVQTVLPAIRQSLNMMKDNGFIIERVLKGYNGAGGDAVIPDGVTSVGEGAFWRCSTVTSITVPDSVASICPGVFYGCTSLKSIAVAPGNLVYHSAGNCLIETQSKTLVAGCKTGVIPADGSVTGIGLSAFEGCTGLRSITIPDGVTFIDGGAFAGCTGLASVAIGNSVTSICKGAFRDCTSLTSVTIPDSVTLIGDFAVNEFPDLTDGVFEGCTSLKSVTIPDSVTYIDDCTFLNCVSLTVINFAGTKEEWNDVIKGENWASGTGKYIVHCTDGDIE